MVNNKLTGRRRPESKTTGKVPMTYYRSSSGTGSNPKSPFIRKKPPARVKKFLFGTLDIVVIVVLLGAFLYSLIISDEPSIAATSYKYRSSEIYKQAVEAELQSLNSRNKLTIDEQRIVENLQMLFPEILEGDVELPVISQKPIVYLTIAEPAFVLKSNGSSYIVASSGMVVGEASKFTQFINLPYVDDQSDFEIEVGQPAFSSESAMFIEDVWRNVDSANVEISSLVLPALPMELNLRTSDKPYFVKFDLSGDSSLQVGQFLAARQQFQKDGTTLADYLDVRVQGKIFYK